MGALDGTARELPPVRFRVCLRPAETQLPKEEKKRPISTVADGAFVCPANRYQPRPSLSRQRIRVTRASVIAIHHRSGRIGPVWAWVGPRFLSSRGACPTPSGPIER